MGRTDLEPDERSILEAHLVYVKNKKPEDGNDVWAYPSPRHSGVTFWPSSPTPSCCSGGVQCWRRRGCSIPWDRNGGISGQPRLPSDRQHATAFSHPGYLLSVRLVQKMPVRSHRC